MENILWKDLKEFMYNLEIEEHLETFWDFLEDKGLFNSPEALQEEYNRGHEDGYDEAVLDGNGCYCD